MSRGTFNTKKLTVVAFGWQTDSFKNSQIFLNKHQLNFNREVFSKKKIPHWLVVEHRSYCHKNQWLWPWLLRAGEHPLLHENSSTSVPTVSKLAAPALSLSGPQPPFSLYSAWYPPPCHLQSLPAESFPFPSHLWNQLCSHRSPQIEAMQCIFLKDMVPQLWTHTSSYKSFSCRQASHAWWLLWLEMC